MATTYTTPLSEIDLSDLSLFQDGPPLDVLARLRENAPIHFNKAGAAGEAFWSVTRFDDIVAVSKDSATYSSTEGSTIPRNAALGPLQGLMMVSQDPPQHTQRRNIVKSVFTMRAVTELFPHMETVIDGLIDEVVSKGQCDLRRDIAVPYPLVVIAKLLGVPRHDHAKLFKWTNAIGALQGNSSADAGLMETIDEMQEYLVKFVAKRRSAPQDDLISLLLHAEVDGQRLSDQEVLVSFAELMVAGNETNRNTLVGGAYLLAQHPDQQALLRAKPELVDNAVEEILRFWSPTNYQARTATRDVSLGGQRIAAGDRVVVWLSSANRDANANEDPNRFDIQRRDIQHLSFGGGSRHHCLGATLARAELRIGLKKLLSRLGSFELLAEPSVLPSMMFHALDSLPIRFTASA